MEQKYKLYNPEIVDKPSLSNNTKKQPATCDCPNGGGDRGVIVMDTKAHLQTCRFRKKIAKDHETLFFL